MDILNTVADILPLLKTLIEGLGKHFGDNCEFVIHDYSKEFSSSIVAISNGNVTHRYIGDSGTNIGLRVMHGDEQSDGLYNYVSQTPDGRFLRSSTIYLKNDSGKIIGSLCANYDITDVINSRNFLDKFINLGKKEPSNVETIVYNDVNDMLVSMINDSIAFIGTPVAMMSREQKIEGINYLNKKGVFKIKNATIIVAKYYDVSRYTIYNYLNEQVKPSE